VRRFAALAVAAVTAMLIQTTVLAALPALPIVPDLVLILAVYLGVRRQTVGGVVAAFLLGYFLDTFSGTLLGLNAFAFSAAYLAVRWIARHLWLRRGLPIVAVALFGGVVRSLSAMTIEALLAGRAPVWQDLVGYGLVGVFLAAVLAPAVFAAVAWEERLLGLS
jgi:rod shape-determining protein MreD